MKKILLSITLAFASVLCQATPLVLETVFFDQCSCQEDSFSSQEKQILQEPISLQGNDRYSCQEENSISGVPSEAGLVFEVNSRQGIGFLNSSIDSFFARKADGDLEDYFLTIGFDNVQEISEMLPITLFEIPEDNIKYQLEIRPSISGNFAVFDITDRDSSFGTVLLLPLDGSIESFELTIVVQNFPGLDFFSSDRRSFVCLKEFGETVLVNCDFLSRGPIVSERNLTETTELILFENPLGNKRIQDLAPTFIEFGQNFFSEEEVETIANTEGNEFFVIFDIAEKLVLAKESPAVPSFPNVVTSEVKVSFPSSSEVNLSSLFEEAVEGTTFELVFEDIVGEIELSESFESDGVFFYSPKDPEITEAVQVTIGNEKLSCSFSLQIDIVVAEEDFTGIVVGVSVGSVFLVGSVVAGVAFFKFRKKGSKSERIDVKDDEMEAQGQIPKEEEKGGAAVNPETDI